MLLTFCSSQHVGVTVQLANSLVNLGTQPEDTLALLTPDAVVERCRAERPRLKWVQAVVDVELIGEAGHMNRRGLKEGL